MSTKSGLLQPQPEDCYEQVFSECEQNGEDPAICSDHAHQVCDQGTEPPEPNDYEQCRQDLLNWCGDSDIDEQQCEDYIRENCEEEPQQEIEQEFNACMQDVDPDGEFEQECWNHAEQVCENR